VQTGGNTDVITVAATDKLEHTKGVWKVTQEGGAVWGQDGGVENAGRYGLSLRADRLLNERLSAYALASWRRNTFAGISRQFDEMVGLSFHALVPTVTPELTQPHHLDLEIGAGLDQRLGTDHVRDDFATARAAALYKYYFAEKTIFEASAAYLLNLDDTKDSEARGRVALSAPLSANFGLKLSYEANVRNQPPAGLQKLDSTFSAGIQVSY
jgi:putative salt-induced outer membrane protein YdiY